MAIASCPKCPSDKFIVTAKTYVEFDIKLDEKMPLGCIATLRHVRSARETEWLELECKGCGHKGSAEEFNVAEEFR